MPAMALLVCPLEAWGEGERRLDISIPLPKKARKKLPVIFLMVFSRPLIRGGYTISATNQGSRKNHKKNNWKFFSGLLRQRA
jgi:hypothetical protein